MNALQPYTIARYGVYLAVVVAVLSVWIGLSAGAMFDYAMLRAVLVFVVFTVLGFGAEAAVNIGWRPQTPPPPAPHAVPEQQDE